MAIVNSDIYMLSSDSSALMLQLAKNSVVTARRLDVEWHGAPSGEIFGLGYDLVAFTSAKVFKTVGNCSNAGFNLVALGGIMRFPMPALKRLPHSGSRSRF